VSGTTICQTIFGTSDIDGEIEDAIDKAFDAIEHIENENGEGISLVANQAFEESFDPDVIPRAKNAIVPETETPIVSDRAYGVFLGYSLGLDLKTRSTVEFLRDMDLKMDADIRRHASYIAGKIKSLGLGTRSFYSYI
jgi:hypothetical protein